jgi:hypothetical protein
MYSQRITYLSSQIKKNQIIYSKVPKFKYIVASNVIRTDILQVRNKLEIRSLQVEEGWDDPRFLGSAQYLLFIAEMYIRQRYQKFQKRDSDTVCAFVVELRKQQVRSNEFTFHTILNNALIL